MAKIGLVSLYFAPFAAAETDTAEPTYKGGVKIGKAVRANLSVQRSTESFYADDMLTEQVDEFTSGTLALSSASLDDAAATLIYGYAPAEGEEFADTTDNKSPYGGCGYVQKLMRGGVKYYRAVVFPKVRASVSDDNAETKGANVSYQAEDISLTVFPTLGGGTWRYRKTFDTLAAAEAWIKEKLSITAAPSV
jgi:phi13 family phage major tail protein